MQVRDDPLVPADRIHVHTAPSHRPHRGSDVEAWLVHWRDAFLPQDKTWAGGTIHSNNWHVLDDLLDRYRLLADTGATLESDREAP